MVSEFFPFFFNTVYANGRFAQNHGVEACILRMLVDMGTLRCFKHERCPRYQSCRIFEEVLATPNQTLLCLQSSRAI